MVAWELRVGRRSVGRIVGEPATQKLFPRLHSPSGEAFVKRSVCLAPITFLHVIMTRILLIDPRLKNLFEYQMILFDRLGNYARDPKLIYL